MIYVAATITWLAASVAWGMYLDERRSVLRKALRARNLTDLGLDAQGDLGTLQAESARPA